MASELLVRLRAIKTKLDQAGIDVPKLREVVETTTTISTVSELTDDAVLGSPKDSELFGLALEILGRIGEFGSIAQRVELAKHCPRLLDHDVPDLPLCRILLGTLLNGEHCDACDAGVVARLVRIMRANGPYTGVLRSTIADRSSRLAILATLLATTSLILIGYFDDPATRPDWMYLRQLSEDFMDTPEKHDRATRFPIQRKILDILSGTTIHSG